MPCPPLEYVLATSFPRKIYFNIILPSRPTCSDPKWIFPSVFHIKFYIFHLAIRAICLAHLTTFAFFTLISFAESRLRPMQVLCVGFNGIRLMLSYSSRLRCLKYPWSLCFRKDKRSR
jgi:hypothetical protein